MNELEVGVLEACSEYSRRQQEMLPQLAHELGVANQRVFYEWALRRCTQPGTLAGSDWTYFFHGMECDLRNRKDGRFLRMDFGPGGRVGILDTYGVLRFIMTSVSPWREFPKLRAYFAKEAPPFHEHSGDYSEKFLPVWDRLLDDGFFKMADPDLVALQTKYTTIGPDRLRRIEFPPSISEETRTDCMVAHRLRLSPKAIHFLQTLSSEGAVGFEKENGRRAGAVTAPTVQ